MHNNGREMKDLLISRQKKLLNKGSNKIQGCACFENGSDTRIIHIK